MRVAVTGGTGFIGRALLGLARHGGIEVEALTRRPQDPLSGVTWHAGDLSSPEALAALVAGVDAVVHLAGTVSATNRAAFVEGNVAGTARLLEAARTAEVKRFIFVSSLAAREPALSAYGASKSEAEALVRQDEVPWTIVRPPAVYGPGDRDMLELFRAAAWGVVPMPRGGRASMIHVDDLARLLLSLVETEEEISGKLFEPDDGRPGGWPHGELGRAIGEAVGRRVRVIELAPRTLRWAARADTALRREKARLTLDRADYMAHPDWAVSSGAGVPAELWAPAIATPDGLRETARWYRSRGWL
jgi:nucleoside-diphosphate-sugar epimerase